MCPSVLRVRDARYQNCVYRRGETDLALFASLRVAIVAVALFPLQLEIVHEILQGISRFLNLRRPGTIIAVFLDDLLVEFPLVPANRQDPSVVLLEVGSEFIEAARGRMRAQAKYP